VDVLDALNHLFAAVGRMLLWLASGLVLEELTLGGLAKLLLAFLADTSSRPTAAPMASAPHPNPIQGDAPCSQSKSY
jgi:hypothetical protein